MKKRMEGRAEEGWQGGICMNEGKVRDGREGKYVIGNKE